MAKLAQSNFRLTIRKNWHISAIEENIRTHLPQCNIWGDLNLTFGEYQIVKDKLKETLGPSPSFSRLCFVMDHYPLVIITGLTNFVLFDYNNINFWESWSNEYNFSLNSAQQGTLGQAILKIFKKYNFEIITNEGYKYVSTILYQAGIPGVSYQRLFNIIETTNNANLFDSQEIVSELTGYRQDFVDAAVRRYFLKNTDDAIEIINKLQDLMTSIKEIPLESELPVLPGIPERVMFQYQKWLSRANQRYKTSQHNFHYYLSPRIIYDESFGVSIEFQEQIVPDDSIYRLRWKVSAFEPNCHLTFFSDVFNHGENDVTISSIHPIPPASSYIVELYDDDKPDVPIAQSWNLEGIDVYLAFSPNGKVMKSNQLLLHRKGTTIIYDPDRVNQINNQAVVVEDLYVAEDWKNFNSVRVYALEGDANFTLSSPKAKHHFELKNSFELNFGPLNTLFNEPIKDNEIPVFTQFPSLEMFGYFKNNIGLFSNSHFKLTNRSTFKDLLINAGDLLDSIEDNLAVFYLSPWAKPELGSIYGQYDLKLYDDRKLLKQLIFYYVPNIAFRDPLCSPDDLDFLGKDDGVFEIHKNDIRKLIFDDNTVEIEKSPFFTDWVQVKGKNNKAKIHGTYQVSDKISVPFYKTVRKIECTLWNNQDGLIDQPEKVKFIFPKDLSKSIWKLKVHFTEQNLVFESIELELVDSSLKCIQKRDCFLNRDNNLFITVNSFQEISLLHPYPQYLILRLKSDTHQYEPIPILSLRTFVELKKPTYRSLGKGYGIIWERGDLKPDILKRKELKLTALHDTTITILNYPLDKVKNFTTPSGKKYQGIALNTVLPNGIYQINTVDQKTFNFFDEQSPVKKSFNRNKILTVHGKKYLDTHFSNQSLSLDEWLSAAIVAQSNIDWLKILSQKLSTLLKEQANEFMVDLDLSHELLFSMILTSSEESDLNEIVKHEITNIYTMISEKLINNNQRIKFLELLLKGPYSESECKYIINALQLYLFSPDGKTLLEKQILRRLWSINDKLAILVNLRDCAANPSGDIERIIDRIHGESIAKILRFKASNSCGSESWEECFECFVGNQGGCPHFNLNITAAIWGDSSEYSNLFVVDRKGNFTLRQPIDEDSSSYRILGKNYLQLIYELIQKYEANELVDLSSEANKDYHHIDVMMKRHQEPLKMFEKYLVHRRQGSNRTHEFFYYIGRASLLVALSIKNIVKLHEIKHTFPFWRMAMASCPELVYRDLIIAELVTLK